MAAIKARDQLHVGRSLNEYELGNCRLGDKPYTSSIEVFGGALDLILILRFFPPSPIEPGALQPV